MFNVLFVQLNAPEMLEIAFYVFGDILVYFVEPIDVVVIQKRKVPRGGSCSKSTFIEIWDEFTIAITLFT